MNDTPPKLTFRTALKDLGFFYVLFTLIVSGPSVLSLLQTVFVEHRLVDALQWIVDGYDDIAAVVGGMLEPLLAPAIGWIERLVGVELTLQPYWRPLFILLSMFVIGWTRTAWRAGAYAGAAAFFAFGIAGALVGAAAAAVAPPTLPERVLPIWVAGLPLLILGTFVAAPVAAMEGALEKGAQPGFLASTGLFVLVAIATTLFGAMPGMVWFNAGYGGASAGVLGLGTAIVLMGAIAFWMATGPNQYALNAARLGLVLLGGFLTAGLILVADAALKLL